ncbi:MAG TPA: hypothetical protein VE872_00590 [Candidatus Bathyarchaeia archaeon]|nr:hypothetical protein [Candidatus Bathyarchaeia archaeon]
MVKPLEKELTIAPQPACWAPATQYFYPGSSVSSPPSGLLADIAYNRGHYGEDGFVFGVGGLSLILLLILSLILRKSLARNIANIFVVSTSLAIVAYFILLVAYNLIITPVGSCLEVAELWLSLPFLDSLLPTSLAFLILAALMMRRRRPIEGGLTILYVTLFALFSFWHLAVACAPQYVY